MSGLHPSVEAIGRGFAVLGAATPYSFTRKAELLLSPNHVGERVLVIAGDAVRCSSTLLAAFAGGAKGLTVTTKSGAGPSLEAAYQLGLRLGLPVALAGELNGRPVPGGAIGNSPREAATGLLTGRLVAFRSTNFGQLFTAVTTWAERFSTAGGIPAIAVASFANRLATARWARAAGFDRVVIATGGFYDLVSEEDVQLGGDIIAMLGHPATRLDDEARVMRDAAQHNRSAAGRLERITGNWIGQALRGFGVAADIPAALTGEGLPTPIQSAMRKLLLTVSWIDGVAVIYPQGAPLAPAPQRALPPALDLSSNQGDPE